MPYLILQRTTGIPSTAANLYFDPGNSSSYPGTGTTLTNIGSDGSGITGTMSGVSFLSGTAGGAFDFDGSSDGISFNSYDFGLLLTVAAWVQPDSKSSINTLIANGSAGLSSTGFKLFWNNWQTTDNAMVVEAGNGSSGGTVATGSDIVVDDGTTWQHLAWTWNVATKALVFYKNGVEVGSGTGNASFPSNPNMNQSWVIGNMKGSYYMDSRLGIFKAWKRVLTSQQVLDEYNANKTRYGL